MSLPSEILNQVDQITLGYTAQAYQAVVDSHSSELKLLFILYIAFFGIAVFYGMVSMSLKDASKHILMGVIIFQLATNWGVFTKFFYNTFTSGPEKLTTALIDGDDPTRKLETVFTAGVEGARRIYNQAGAFDISQMFLALLVLIGTILMTGVALFLIILSKLGLAILLSLAPLFIILALWKSTQGVFRGWINYLINCALIPVITYAFLGLILSIIEAPVEVIQNSGENLKLEDIIPYLLTGAVSILLYSQVLRIASSLGGGVTFSAMGAYSNYVTRPASQLSRAVGKQVQLGASKANLSTRTSGKVSVDPSNYSQNLSSNLSYSNAPSVQHEITTKGGKSK